MRLQCCLAWQDLFLFLVKNLLEQLGITKQQTAMLRVWGQSLCWRIVREADSLLYIALETFIALLQQLLFIGINVGQRVCGVLGSRWLV